MGLVTIKNGERSVKSVENISRSQLFQINYIFSLLKPDFLLIRQDPRDAGEDFKSALLGFQYGQVPSINSLESVYNFQVSFVLSKKMLNSCMILERSKNFRTILL